MTSLKNTEKKQNDLDVVCLAIRWTSTSLTEEKFGLRSTKLGSRYISNTKLHRTD